MIIMIIIMDGKVVIRKWAQAGGDSGTAGSKVLVKEKKVPTFIFTLPIAHFSLFIFSFHSAQCSLSLFCLLFSLKQLLFSLSSLLTFPCSSFLFTQPIAHFPCFIFYTFIFTHPIVHSSCFIFYFHSANFHFHSAYCFYLFTFDFHFSQAATQLGVIVGAFIFCWLPYFILFMVKRLFI